MNPWPPNNEEKPSQEQGINAGLKLIPMSAARMLLGIIDDGGRRHLTDNEGGGVDENYRHLIRGGFGFVDGNDFALVPGLDINLLKERIYSAFNIIEADSTNI